jgi:hypothetical protein
MVSEIVTVVNIEVLYGTVDVIVDVAGVTVVVVYAVVLFRT